MKFFPLTLSATALLLSTAFADPLPTNPSVAAGSASFSSGANSLVVTQSTSNAIINWNTFSVGSGNTVQFVQPSTSSAVLNRVTSTDPSQIYGQVSANGQFFLVNPNGILVGSGGRIDSNGIFLSTNNITDSNFLTGNIRFDGPSSESITISGDLNSTAGVYVHAGGSINGSANITAGSDVTLAATLGSVTVGTINTINNGSSSPVSSIDGGGASGSVTISSGNFNINQTSSRLTGRTVSQVVQPNFSIVAAGPISIGLVPSGQLPVAAGTAIQSSAVVSTAIPAVSQPASTQGTITASTPPTTASRGNSQPSPTIGSNVSGLTDGVVTVRMSLVDAAPIVLR